jgi:hypothetical protein
MKEVWAMSSTDYVKKAVQEVERELSYSESYLPKQIETPLSSNYLLELDFSRELDANETNYYQGLIGVLRWIVELGRIDIIVPVSLLSRYLVSPREGHLQQGFHIFAYLKQFNRARIVFDDGILDFGDTHFRVCDWSTTYPNAAEVMPPNMPEARGLSVVTSCNVDADHAGCRVTRRSHTGLLIFVNNTPIIWFSKRQNTVNLSTFGSEFIALKIAIDQIEAIRYKLRMLRMFGIPLEGCTSIFCDNESVVKNATRSESTLGKIQLPITYHRCREAVAAGFVRIGHIEGEINPNDVLTKILPGARLRKLLQRIFFWKS